MVKVGLLGGGGTGSEGPGETVGLRLNLSFLSVRMGVKAVRGMLAARATLARHNSLLFLFTHSELEIFIHIMMRNTCLALS